MSFRQILSAIFLFLFPGISAGWIFAATAIKYAKEPAVYGMIFSGAALAGALTCVLTGSLAGRWKFLLPTVMGIGLFWLIFIPAININFLFPAMAFSFGVFAAIPIRPVNRLFFQGGVLLAAFIALMALTEALTNPILTRLALIMLIPATAILGTQGAWARKLMISLFVFCGLVTVTNSWKNVDQYHHITPWGNKINTSSKGEEMIFTSGNKTFYFPRALVRKMPDLMTSSLLPEAESVRILTLAVTSHMGKEYLKKFHWIRSVGTYSFQMPYVLWQLQPPYDLIFILEFPDGPRGAAETFLRSAANALLAPGGVIAAPAEYDPEITGFYSVLLPGSRNKVRLWAANGTPPADTFEKLEQRLASRSGNQVEYGLDGMLETLLDVRPQEQDWVRKTPSPMERYLEKIQSFLPSPVIVFPAILILLLGIAWFSRSPRSGENFSIFVHGTACMLSLLVILQEAEKYQFLLDYMPIAAILAVLAVALPHRAAKTGRRHLGAVILLCTAGAALLPDWPIGSPWEEDGGLPMHFLRTLIQMTLLLTALAMKWGCTHKGGEAARYLHFAGLLFGAILAQLFPHWTALLTALLLFAA